MADHVSILSQTWTDIVPPVAPQPMTWWFVLSSLTLLVLVVLGVIVLWRQRPRQRALRVLQRCQRQLDAAALDSRLLAFAIYEAVLQGLSLNPALALKGISDSDQQWLAFYQRLQQCVFQAAPPATDELSELIRQGRYWLRHYPQ